MASLRPGSLVGRYRIQSRLGAGGMGVVYLARDEALERQVALKVLAPELAADAGFRVRFAAEARAAAAVDHPHLLPVFEAGEDAGVLFLAMRYVPGFDLGTIIAREGGLPVDRTVELVRQVAAALDAAHEAGLVHRDVKPANILIAPGDHAYLADFGLARAATAESGITRPGRIAAGSAEYLAPELLDGRPADPRSDLYALACVAFTCLTGRSPFRRPDDIATLYAHAHESPPSPTSLRVELPPALDPVLARGLEKDPARRPTSAGGFARALGEAAKGVGVLALQPDVAPHAAADLTIEGHGPAEVHRVVPAAGLLSIGLDIPLALLGAALLPFLESNDPPASQLLEMYRRQPAAVLALAGLNVIAVAALPVLLVGLSQALERFAPQVSGLAKTASWASIAGAVVLLFAILVRAMPAFRIAESGDAGLVSAMWDTSVFVEAVTVPLHIIAIGAVSLAIIRSRMISAWIGFFGLALAPATLVSMGLVLLDVGEAADAAREVMTAANVVWIFGVSLLLLRLSRTLRS